MHVLPDALASCDPDGSRKGTTWWNSRFRKAMKQAKIYTKERNLAGHSFRHSLHTILRSKGCSDEKIRAALGWSNPKTQADYTLWTTDHLREQAEIVDGLLSYIVAAAVNARIVAYIGSSFLESSDESFGKLGCTVSFPVKSCCIWTVTGSDDSSILNYTSELKSIFLSFQNTRLYENVNSTMLCSDRQSKSHSFGDYRYFFRIWYFEFTSGQARHDDTRIVTYSNISKFQIWFE